MEVGLLDGHLPDTQAVFRPARGCRNSVCALRWFTSMVLRDGRNAVITFMDNSSAFDTEIQIFLDGAFADVGEISEPFNIERGMLQGDIFSPVSFIAGLDKIFRTHDGCQLRCHGLPVYAVCVCNKVRLPGTGQSAHVIGGSRFTRPASNSRRTLLN